MIPLAEPSGSIRAAESRYGLQGESTMPLPTDPSLFVQPGFNNRSLITEGLSAAEIQKMIDKAVAQAGADVPELEDRAPVTPAEVDAWIRKYYGYMAAYMNHPEVGRVLREAARLEIKDEEQLFGLLYPTNWWKTTNDAQRQWDLLVNTDPATAQRQTLEKTAYIQNRLGILGIDADAGHIATTALRAGWSDEQITDYMVGLTKGQIDYTRGQLGAHQATVKQLASAYMLHLSGQSAAQYARQMASGELDAAGVQAMFIAQAKQRFNWMIDEIDAGLTPQQFFLPLRDTIAQELEMNPNAIDPMDSEWLRLMEVTDPKTGKTRGATQTEVFDAVRRDPRWWQTNRATDLTANLGMGLMTRFGLV